MELRWRDASLCAALSKIMAPCCTNLSEQKNVKAQKLADNTLLILAAEICRHFSQLLQTFGALSCALN